MKHGTGAYFHDCWVYALYRKCTCAVQTHCRVFISTRSTRVSCTTYTYQHRHAVCVLKLKLIRVRTMRAWPGMQVLSARTMQSRFSTKIYTRGSQSLQHEIDMHKQYSLFYQYLQRSPSTSTQYVGSTRHNTLQVLDTIRCKHSTQCASSTRHNTL